MQQQSVVETYDFEKLENAIGGKEALQQTQKQLVALKQKAINAHDDVSLAHALNELMKIKDLRTEDTLYFRNSAFMDTLINSPAASPSLKAIMYVLQAQRLNNFNTRYLRFNRAAYRSKYIPVDYAAYSPEQLDSTWTADLKAALKHLFTGQVKNLLWLSTNADVFLFEPRFEDIVLSEYVNQAALKNYYNFNEEGETSTWPSLPSAIFRKKLDSLAQHKAEISVLTGYQRWLTYNIANSAVASFIESLARKYIFANAGEDSIARQSYNNYLLAATSSPYPATKAHAVYQLCLLWNEDGNKYMNNPYNYRYVTYDNFNPEYQFLPAKALQLYNQHKALLKRYHGFDTVLTIMAGQILSAGIKIEMDDKIIPNTEIPFKALYKNSSALYYRIIKANIDDTGGHTIVTATTELMARNPVIKGKFVLPLPDDHNRHAVYLKLPPLPAGHYRLLFNNAELKNDHHYINNISFQATSIAPINSDERLYVLDRKTGFPLAGARVQQILKKVNVSGNSLPAVNQKGYINIPGNDADSINIFYKGDTLGYKFSVHENDLNDHDDLYDKTEYDDLEDFYEDKLKMEIFTDRSIYRPGQTVHYKIILLTNNPETGEKILFNRKNLGSKAMDKWLMDKNNIVTFSDPFKRKIDSVKLIPNDFGSFAGSFVIPKTAATGEWNIDGPGENDYNNEGDFKVEEYKRPTIELSMEKQKKLLKPGQPFAIKLKLRSFSGGALGNIPISYILTRSGNLPSAKRTSRYNYNYQTVSLLNTTGHTNDKGELLIPVTDSLLAKYKWNDDEKYTYNYSLEATATDATGETSEINEGIAISNRPVQISINIDKIYDRQALPQLKVNTIADFEGIVDRNVSVKIYKVTDPERTGRNFSDVDQWYYPEADWDKWFPGMAVVKPVVPQRVLVLDTVINTADHPKLVLSKEKFITGFYELEAVCKDSSGATTGKIASNFKVFDSAAGTVPGADIDFISPNYIKHGDIITWYSSNTTANYTIYQVLYEAGKTHRVIKNIYSEETEQAGLRRWVYRVPANAAGNLVLERIYVSGNRIINHQKTVYLDKDEGAQPEIIVEKYRKIMAPGAQETFTLSVKTNNVNTAAELMITLYDASLDKLNKHKWQLPRQEYYNRDPYARWDYTISSLQFAGSPGNEEPVYLRGALQDKTDISTGLAGRVAGLSVTAAHGLNEVAVLPGFYSTQRITNNGAVSSIMIRGVSSIKDYDQPLLVIDGEIYTNNDMLKKLDPASIRQMMILKGADAAAIFGASAANGVLIISTKGPIILPEAPEPVIKVRKNFNETAFFFPQLHAGADGYYSFSFTMPESATEWNWKMLAHTQNASFAYLEKKLQTQLNLMVQPNMPRLLYQGDKIKLQSRITNLDTVAIHGNITCKIEDEVTGEDITTALLNNNRQPFSLDKKSSGAAAFMLTVPAGQLNPLKIVISAATATTADAEEHVIPVLSPKILVRQSRTIQFDQQAAIIIPSVKLPADAQLFGIGISINPKPQAALVYALPWLANYSYDCAEQTFNKLNALATALKLMRSDTSAQKIYAQAARGVKKEINTDDPLPGELAADATPWVSIGSRTATREKGLFKVLDTSASKTSIDKYLERLHKLQQADGGLAWFDGGKSSEYISAYVLAGFGQLKQQGWQPDAVATVRFQQFIKDLFNYNKDLALKSTAANYDAWQIYALSYWPAEEDASATLTGHVNTLLNSDWLTKPDNSPLERQALLIINTFRYNPPASALYQTAQHQLENIYQLAIQEKENGLRWKDISDAEELNTSAEETMALLSEAFGLSGKYPGINPGMVKWLLTTRQDQHWQTTKATAAAIDMLQKEKGSVIGESKAFSTEIAGQHLTVSDDLLSGIPSAFVATKQLPADITLQQQSTAASGAVTWYYFTIPASLDMLNKAVHISKQFYSYYKDKGWIPFTTNTQLKTGDKVKVKLTIETASRLKFVHISDPRAAAFEPADNNSGYQYSDGLSYYQSVKDTGLELFTEDIPRGISEISYDLIVAMDGQFTSGPARLQCMYQPSITAYSTAQTVITEQ